MLNRKLNDNVALDGKLRDNTAKMRTAPSMKIAGRKTRMLADFHALRCPWQMTTRIAVRISHAVLITETVSITPKEQIRIHRGGSASPSSIPHRLPNLLASCGIETVKYVVSRCAQSLQ
jgi:hypothetical protein